ncbi:MAG: sugar phosphate isomerase/epimerase [Chloroflexota bacterium]|nr:sugar phosphate isomerase/epimerase [Chloroflexota bacterium]PLS81657.1 MAG: sugar phosphate isomerase/epimerase [Chloroflexota bacterium]
MRLAFTTLACPGWTLEQAAEAAGRYGYEGLELRLLDGELVTPALSVDQQARVRHVCADAGLELCCLDTSLKVADPAASLDEGYGYLDLAAVLGSPLIRVFGGAPNGEPLESSAPRAAERLAALAERGRSVGVRVALETHDTFAAGQAVAAALASVPDEYAGALWDTLHPVRVGETAEETLDLIGGRLLHMHIKDGNVQPNINECRLLGEGTVPVQEILRALAARGYRGWLAVEWEKKWQPQIAEPEVALPQYAETLRTYLGELGVTGQV